MSGTSGVFVGRGTPLWRESEGVRHEHNGVIVGERETEARICSVLGQVVCGYGHFETPLFPWAE